MTSATRCSVAPGSVLPGATSCRVSLRIKLDLFPTKTTLTWDKQQKRNTNDMKRSTRYFRRRAAFKKRRLPRALSTRMGSSVLSLKRTFQRGPLEVERKPINYWGPTYNAYTIADCPGASEIVNLFQLYKIHAIKMTFTLAQNVASFDNLSAAGSEHQHIPILHTCLNYQDAPVDVVEDMQQHSSYKQYRLDRPVTLYFKPRVMNTVGPYYANPISPWMSTAVGSGSARYRGLSWIVDGGPIIGVLPIIVGQLYISHTYYFSCKYTK